MEASLPNMLPFPNAPGKPFFIGRDEHAKLIPLKVEGIQLCWRGPKDPRPTDSGGFVKYHSSELKSLGFRVYPTGDYHIGARSNGGTVTYKFQCDIKPDAPHFVGIRDLKHLWFEALSNSELPVHYYWDEPPAAPSSAESDAASTAPNPEEGAEYPEDAEDQQADEIDMSIRQEIEQKAAEENRNLQPRLVNLPDITPADPRWGVALERFQNLLRQHIDGPRNRSLLDFMNEHFLEAQIRLLNPSADRSRLALLQERNALLYFDALQNGPFKDINNNAITKFTMAYFGLPVEPLTITNIIKAMGGQNENDAREIPKADYTILSRLYGQEAELEWLDPYDERAHGYPALRRNKANRPYKRLPEEIADLIGEHSRIQAEKYPMPRMMCGGNSSRWFDEFENDFKNFDDSSDGDDDDDIEHPNVSMRGGAGPSDILEDIEMDEYDSSPDEEQELDASGMMPEFMSLRGGAADEDAELNANLARHAATFEREEVARREKERLETERLKNVQGAHPSSSAQKGPNASAGIGAQRGAKKPAKGKAKKGAIDPSAESRDLAAKYPEFYKEQEENFRQQDLRVQAFEEEQSIHDPEPMHPAPPIYGKAVEELVNPGPLMPSIYVNNLSLNGIRALQMRNRNLENVILGRQHHCGVCDKFIKFTTKEAKDAHYAGHRAGTDRCGFCGEDWDGLDDIDRRQHLATHANVPWSRSTPNQPGAANAAAATKTPAKGGLDGQLQVFCQNCGIDMGNFKTIPQVIAHSLQCSAPRFDNSSPQYCKYCAMPLAGLRSDQLSAHQEMCKGRSAKDGRKRELWTVAAQQHPNDEEAAERLYFELAAMTGIPNILNRAEHRVGPSECRFVGCEEDIFDLARRGRLREHHAMHVSREDPYKFPCQHEWCKKDLAALENEDEEVMDAHLSEHTTFICGFPGCGRVFQGSDIVDGAVEINVWTMHQGDHFVDLEEERERTEQPTQPTRPTRQTRQTRQTQRGQRAPGAETGAKRPAKTKTAGRPKAGGGTKTGEGAKTGGRPKTGGGANVYPHFPPEWLVALKNLDKLAQVGEEKIGPWGFYCPTCLKHVTTGKLHEHRSVTRDGKAGSCGIDNEDDFLVHTSYWMGRVRSKNQNTGLETLVDLMTWGERRKQKHFVDYFTAHPVTLQKEPLPGLIGGEEEEEEEPAEEDQPEEEGQDEGEQPDEGGEENENEEGDGEESEESDDQPRPKIKTTKRPPDDSAAHVPSAKRKRL